MLNRSTTSIAVAIFAGAAALFPAAAVAGTCPAGQVRAAPQAATGEPAKNVKDDLLTSIDVAAEPIAIANRQFRLRRLTIQPGGVVPYHSHGDRPAIIYVVQGTVSEYASTCAVPIVHKAGEATPELHQTSHWWKNTGRKPAILLSSDLFPVGIDGKTM